MLTSRATATTIAISSGPKINIGAIHIYITKKNVPVAQDIVSQVVAAIVAVSPITIEVSMC